MQARPSPALRPMWTSCATPTVFRTSSRQTNATASTGLGFVHAQDRFVADGVSATRRIWTPLGDFRRRHHSTQDRFLRTIGFGRAARTAWTHLPEDAREQINAYVAGVNAFIGTHHGRTLPPSFPAAIRTRTLHPGRRDGLGEDDDGWDLSANFSSELLRHDMLAAIGPDKMAQLMPPCPADGLQHHERPAVSEPRATQRRPPTGRTPRRLPRGRRSSR